MNLFSRFKQRIISPLSPPSDNYIMLSEVLKEYLEVFQSYSHWKKKEKSYSHWNPLYHTCEEISETLEL